MSEQPVQLDTLVVQVHEVPLRQVPGGPDSMFVQANGTGNVLVDFADGLDEWGKPLELNEAEYEGLRQEAYRRELADLEDIPTYTQLYPSPGNNSGGASTTPNGNTQGRVVGETPASGKAADDSNAEVESETSAENVTGDEILDGVQLGLDIVGLIPVVGEIADIANAGISLARGDYAGAALSLVSAIPFAGYVGTAGKVGRHAAKATAEASAKAAKQMADRAAKEAAEKTAKESSEHAIKHADGVRSKSQDGAKVTGGDHAKVDYSSIENPPSVGPNKDFTLRQKQEALELNRAANGGVVKSDASGTVLVKPQKSQRGVTPDPNEWQFDHKKSKKCGGTNCSSNLDILSRQENRAKSDK